MKKKLFLFATAALVLAGCNNDVTIDENVALEGSNAQKEIAFTPYAQTPKRSQGKYAVMTADFPTENTMEVAAYLTQPSAKNYFTKTTFENHDGVWTGGKYWPLAVSKLNFFAVSAFGVTNTHITIGDDLTTASVAYTTGNSYSQTTQSDIMYAFGRGAVTQSGQLFNFPTVDMQFKHALALIDFQVKANSATEAGAIKVNSISLKGATYNGSLALANENADTEAGAVTPALTWTPGTAVDDAVAVPGIAALTTITTSYARIGKGLMVIPTTGFTSFVINYTCEGVAYDFEYTPNPAVTTTTANYKYVYQINFKMHEIEIAPTVAAWTDAPAAPEITIPNMVYGQNYSVNASKDAQTLSFTLTGLTNAKYIKVTKGGTDAAQVTSSTPALNTVVETTATKTITVTLDANAGAAKTMTITIQQYDDSEGNTASESPAKPTVITINQAAGA